MSKIIDAIQGSAVVIPGNDIDTDQITPARFLKEITFENMGGYLFYDLRFTESGEETNHPLNQDQHKDAKIMIVGKNFGCGSSREHAPQAIKRYGIKAIIGESFAEIFSGNCKALGVPLLTSTPETLEKLAAIVNTDPTTVLAIDIPKSQVTVNNENIPLNIKADRKDAFLDGSWDVLSVLKGNENAIHETANKLKYINNFQSN